METKDKILEVTLNAFLLDGYDEISLNEIIRRTGLTKGAFYHYFGSKEELVEEVIDRYLISYLDGYAQDLDEMEGSALDKIYSLTGRFEFMIKFVLPNEKIADPGQFITLLCNISRSHPRIREKERESAQKILDLLTKLITEGKEEGSIRIALSSSDLARLIFLSLRGTMVEWAANPEGSLRDSLMHTVKSIVGLLG